jgi:hypothetical protein
MNLKHNIFWHLMDPANMEFFLLIKGSERVMERKWKGGGCGYKKSIKEILVLTELLCILAVLMPISWL